MKVLFDTSDFNALASQKDRHHAEAIAKMERLAEERHPVYTTNAVLYETCNWLAVRMGPRQASKFGREIRRGSDMTIVALGLEDETGALSVLEKFSQIQMSFVDASSIYLFKKLGMDRVFSFDRHFAQANVPLL